MAVDEKNDTANTTYDGEADSEDNVNYGGAGNGDGDDSEDNVNYGGDGNSDDGDDSEDNVNYGGDGNGDDGGDSEDNVNYGGDGNGGDGDDSEDNVNYGGDGDSDDVEADQFSVQELEPCQKPEPESGFEQEETQTPNQMERNYPHGGLGYDSNPQGGLGYDSNPQGGLEYDGNLQGGLGYDNENPQGGCRRRNRKNRKGKGFGKGNTNNSNSNFGNSSSASHNSNKNNYQNYKQSHPANNFNESSNYINYDGNNKNNSNNNNNNNSTNNSNNSTNNNNFKKSNNSPNNDNNDNNKNNNNNKNSNNNNYNNKNSNNNNYNNKNNNNNYNNKNNNNNCNNNKFNKNNKNSSSSSSSSNQQKNDDGNKGPKKVEFFSQLKGIITSSFKHHNAGPSPIDSLVLKLHYRMGVCLFLIAYNIIQSNWFLGDSIHCASQFNVDENIKFNIKNICLSYPYICEGDEIAGVKKGSCSRQYILFYRWVYFSFLLVAGIYYIPRVVAKKAENPRLRKLLADLARGENRYDGYTWEKDTEIMLEYLHNHTSTHNTLYIWHVMCHVVALAIDIGIIFFFDFCLNGRFLKLIYEAYPFDRDPEYFMDELSRTFPPFVHCAINTSMLIYNKREEHLGCHLMLMELYEKMFIVIWFWLAMVTLCTSLSVVFLLLVALPPFNRLFLQMHTTSKDIRNIKKKVLKLCAYGDLYVLYLMKYYRSEAQFIMFLKKFVHKSDGTLQEVVVEGEHKKSLNWRERLTSMENITDASSNVENKRLINDSQALPPHQEISYFPNKYDSFQKVSTSSPFSKSWHHPPTEKYPV